MIALEDLNGMTEQEIINHLASEYSGSGEQECMTGTDEEVEIVKKMLEQFEILIAYESVGDFGCDSSSFFLLKHKETGKFYEIHGSHCSCYGFEGQLDLEETDIASLKHRIENGGNIFYCGGYDGNTTVNKKVVNDFVESL